MPTLNWIGKEAVVKHHKDVPYRLLEPVPELSCGDATSGNLIVQGDNLHALKALLPHYAGQPKCICHRFMPWRAQAWRSFIPLCSLPSSRKRMSVSFPHIERPGYHVII